MAHRVLDMGEIPSMAKACQRDITAHGKGHNFFQSSAFLRVSNC